MGENTKGQKYHYIQYITISNIYCTLIYMSANNRFDPKIFYLPWFMLLFYIPNHIQDICWLSGRFFGFVWYYTYSEQSKVFAHHKTHVY